MLIDKINKFVKFSIESKGVDIYKESFNFFSENDRLKDEFNLVVPELLDLPKTKRDTVKSIIKEKTNYNIEPNANHFKLSLKIKEVGDTTNKSETYDWQDG